MKFCRFFLTSCLSLMQKLDERLKSEHQEAMSGVMMANRAAIDAVKKDADKLRGEEIEELGRQHAEEKGMCIETLML